jgi:hypothetical protein
MAETKRRARGEDSIFYDRSRDRWTGRSRSAGSQASAGTGSSFAAGLRPRSRTSYAPGTRILRLASARPPITPSSSA